MAEGAAHQADDEVATHADDVLDDATHQSDDLADTATHQADEVLDAATPSRTTPSHHPDPTRRPTGRPERWSPNDEPEKIRAITRQNESGETLTQAGYDVEYQPDVPGSRKKPDYRIEGEIFDGYAPRTSDLDTVMNKFGRKVRSRQATRMVLNLDDSPISMEMLRQRLNDRPIQGLQEVIVLKGGDVIPLFP